MEIKRYIHIGLLQNAWIKTIIGKYLFVWIYGLIFFAIAYSLTGGLTDHNIVSAFRDMRNGNINILSYGKPYKPSIQMRAAKEIGYNLIFAGCQGGPILGIQYNAIMTIFAQIKIGNDWEERERILVDEMAANEDAIYDKLNQKGNANRIFGCVLFAGVERRSGRRLWKSQNHHTQSEPYVHEKDTHCHPLRSS